MTGCIITIDALGTQTEIAKTIIGAGAEYVLVLKENQETLYNGVELYFKEEILTKQRKSLKKKVFIIKHFKKRYRSKKT